VGSYEATWKDEEVMCDAMRLPGKMSSLCGKL
jgi:hypothetical protein